MPEQAARSTTERRRKAAIRRDALEHVGAAVLELDPGPGDEVLDGLRHEHLAFARLGRDARARVHGDPADGIACELDLAGVEPGTHAEPGGGDVLRDGARAADRPRRPVERREEAVAGGVDLAAAKACEVAAHDLVVPLEQIAPAPVAQFAGAPGRSDDVGEQHGREHAIWFLRLANTRQELADLLHDVVPVDPGEMCVARQLDVFRALDVPREPAGVLDVADFVVDTVHDQGRRVDRRDDVADVDLEGHVHERDGVVRARRLYLEPAEQLEEALIVAAARRDVAEDGSLTPDLDDVLDPEVVLELLPRGLAPGPIFRFLLLDLGAAQDERPCALRIRRREEHRQRAALGDPFSTALRDAAASMIARISSIRSSSVPTRTRSDRPMPRLSKQITRANDASCSQ
jgi:hypothetical protein